MEHRLDHLPKIKDDEPVDPPEIPEDWMLRFPLPYLISVFDGVDHHGWQALPAAGGLDDQDADLVDDVQFLFQLRRAIQIDRANNG